MRAFARTLKISPASLSQIFSGKRSVTLATAKKICDSLSLTPLEQQTLLSNFFTLSKTKDLTFVELDTDRFKLIADWEHLAILSLTQVQNSKPDPAWISKRLGISVPSAKNAMERLQRLGLLEIKDKKWKQTNSGFSVNSAVPSSAIRKFHRQILEKALFSLENDPVGARDFGAITMAINIDRYEEARKLIKEFRKNMSKFLESGKQSQVYTLAIQFFPLDQKEQTKEQK